MSPLDSMLSQYQGNQNQAPAAPRAPAVGSAVPNSFFSAVPQPPASITPGAFSRGFSPFGASVVPDLSQADPNTLARFRGGMEGLVYNLQGGGYIHGDHPAGPGTNYGPYYKGTPPASDPSANRSASDFYNYIGSLPTRSAGTMALNQLTAGTPGTGPSLNTQVGGRYGGPFAFPGWNMGNLLGNG